MNCIRKDRQSPTLWMRALLAACMMSSHHVAAQAPPPSGESQGQLLYSTHCVACHTTEVHWRDKRLANNWTSLKAQVNRWQANSGLGWRDAEIVEVARYLNELYYHFPQTGDQVGLDDPRERYSRRGKLER